MSKIDYVLKTRIIDAMENWPRLKDRDGNEISLNGTERNDRYFWICMLFSKAKYPTDIDTGNFCKYLQKNFRTKTGGANGYGWAEKIWGNPDIKSSNWNTERFCRLMDNIDEEEKEQLIQSINEIEDVHIENVNEITEILKKQLILLHEELKEKKVNSKNISSTNTQENGNTKEKEYDISFYKITAIIISVMAVIFLIILFIVNNQHKHLGGDINLPTETITTTIISTEKLSTTTTTSMTITTALDDFTSNISTEVTTTLTDKNDSNTVITTHTTGKSSNETLPTETPNTIAPPVDTFPTTDLPSSTAPPESTSTQAIETHTPITTYSQVLRTSSSLPEITITSAEANKGDSDVCIKVVFSDLILRGNYDTIDLNFNAIYDRDLIFKKCDCSQGADKIANLYSENGIISFNFQSEICENDITIELYFDIPNDALPGDYIVHMLEDASRITLYTPNDDYIYNNLYRKYDSLYRCGVIHVS